MKLKLFVLAVLMGGTIFAAETIPFRGVVEGYYGRPWGTEGRIALLNFMGKVKMNTFIYGPKDDPYHHGKWRELYPEEQIADFRRVLEVAKKNRVIFYWAIHLGGTFRRGDESEYTRMYAKFDQLYQAGVRGFAVFFDDFGGSDASFHAEICNRIQREYLDKKGSAIAPMIVCPHVYWGAGHQYQKTLGSELDKKINIMWTGGSICSDIRAQDVERITADFQRPPFIWWNWPVNDYCRSKLLLGRTYGLEKAKLAGFVSNPMENCEANKLALYGVAKWCLDPDNFDSKATWEESFKKIYRHKEVAKAMRIFAEHNSDQGPNGHGYRKEESVSAAPLIAKAREELKKGELDSETEKELKALFTEVGKASATLLKMLPKDHGLGWEIQGWLEAERFQMQTGIKTLELCRAKSKKERGKILGELKRIRQNAERAVEAHKAKFAEATFSGDKNHINAPVASNRELKPFIEGMLEKKLRELYRAKTGEDIEEKDGFKAFSSAKGWRNPQVSIEGKVAGIKRTLEPKIVEPGASFGIMIPASWKSDYFHARFDSPRPVQSGVIEISKDGATWVKLETKDDGNQMQTKLEPNAGWKAARYRNTSSSPVSLKIELFKFDVRGNLSPIDSMLKELCD